MADRLGVPFNEQVNQRLRGVSRRASLEIILGERCNDYSDEEKLALAEEKSNILKLRTLENHNFFTKFVK